jgi:hypothetical protein
MEEPPTIDPDEDNWIHGNDVGLSPLLQHGQGVKDLSKEHFQSILALSARLIKERNLALDAESFPSSSSGIIKLRTIFEEAVHEEAGSHAGA